MIEKTDEHCTCLCSKNYYKEGDKLYPQFDSTEAYRRALKTWARWVDKNMDPKKSVVFYRGYSTAHFRHRSIHDTDQLQLEAAMA